MTVLLALTPTLLKFQSQSRATYRILVTAACAELLLLLFMIPRLGATGAALAYLLAMSGMYAAFWVKARPA